MIDKNIDIQNEWKVIKNTRIWKLSLKLVIVLTNKERISYSQFTIALPDYFLPQGRTPRLKSNLSK